jgi:hypothetical protein
LWVVIDHDTLSGSDHTYEVRMFKFNLASEAWVSGYIAGPTQTYIATTGVCLADACLRGADEIIVAWNANVDPEDPKAFIDIYNTTSATWTSTDISVFDGSDPALAPAPVETLAWDGAYVHIFSQLWFDDNYSEDHIRLHRTMDSSNGLGAEADLMAVIDAAWVPAIQDDPGGTNSDDCYNHSLFAQIHDGKIFVSQDCKVTIPYTTDNRQVICFYANIGEATPTWASEAVYLPLDSDGEYAFWNILFVAGGTLHCAFIYTEDFDSVFIYTTKRVGGTWTTPALFYGYDNNPPYFDNYTFDGSGLNIRSFAAIPDTATPARFSMMATLNYDFQVSVWYLSTEENCGCNVMY